MKKIQMSSKEKREKLWKEKKEILVGDIFYNYIGDHGNVNYFQVVSVEENLIKCIPMEIIYSQNIPRETIPGRPIEGKVYTIKNKEILRQWCFIYPQEDPIYQYDIETTPKNLSKNL